MASTSKEAELVKFGNSTRERKLSEGAQWPGVFGHICSRKGSETHLQRGQVSIPPATAKLVSAWSGVRLLLKHPGVTTKALTRSLDLDCAVRVLFSCDAWPKKHSLLAEPIILHLGTKPRPNDTGNLKKFTVRAKIRHNFLFVCTEDVSHHRQSRH